MKTEEMKAMLNEAVATQKNIMDSFLNRKNEFLVNTKNTVKDILDKIKETFYYIDNNMNEFIKEASKLNFYSYDKDLTKFGINAIFKKVDFCFSNKLIFLSRDKFTFRFNVEYDSEDRFSYFNFIINETEEHKYINNIIEKVSKTYMKKSCMNFSALLNELAEYVKSFKFKEDIDNYLKDYFSRVIAEELKNDIELTKQDDTYSVFTCGRGV